MATGTRLDWYVCTMLVLGVCMVQPGGATLAGGAVQPGDATLAGGAVQSGGAALAGGRRAVDDAVFNLTIRGDLNGNGKIDADELGNALDFSAASPIRVTVPPHVGTDPCFTNDTFAPPMYPMTTNVWPALYIPQDNYYDERGTNFVASNAVDFPNAAVTNGLTQTLYVRFRWDGNAVTNYSSTCWIMLNGFDWGLRSGWGVFIEQDSGPATTEGRLGVMVPPSVERVSDVYAVKKGQWYDLFVMVSPRDETHSKAVAWLLPVPTGRYRESDKTYGFDPPAFQRYEKTGSYQLLSFAPNKTTIRLGAEEPRSYWSEIKAANNNDAKTFRGAVARMMLWTRELTDEERWEVASGYDGALWSVGVVNGSADEFAAGGADDVHLVTNAWSHMRRMLTEAEPTLTLKGPLPAAEEGLDHLVNVAPLFGDAKPDACFVRIAVNGVSAGIFNLARRSGRNAYVPGAFWKRDAEGNATLTVTRVAPFTAPLEIDAVTVSGAWMFGTANGSHSEFEHEARAAAHIIRGDPVTKHVRRALLGEGESYRTACFHFYMPPEAAGRHGASFETRTTQMASKLGGHARVNIWFNGEEQEAKEGVSEGDVLDWTFPADAVRPGMNYLVLSNATSRTAVEEAGAGASWIGFDYYRFQTEPEPNGTLLLLR